jgi:hypothetical protein
LAAFRYPEDGTTPRELFGPGAERVHFVPKIFLQEFLAVTIYL